MQEPSICEEERYSELYTDQAEKLRNFLYYKCGDLEKAEDLAQESFLKLWKKCAEVIVGSAVGFLFTVANRLFLDHVRSEKVALKFEKALLPPVSSEDPLFHLRTDEFRVQLEKAISDLPDGQREAFLLNRIDKLTYAQIGEKLEISQTAVEKRIAKALTRLKNDIEELKKRKI